MMNDEASDPERTGPTWPLALMNGMAFGGLVLVTQFLAAYPLTNRFGPEASYAAFLTGLWWAFASGASGMIVGARAWGRSRRAGAFSAVMARLWIWQSLAVIAMLLVSLFVAWRHESQSPTRWIPR